MVSAYGTSSILATPIRTKLNRLNRTSFNYLTANFKHRLLVHVQRAGKLCGFDFFLLRRARNETQRDPALTEATCK